MVYVQDIDGKPMMPTTRHGKVRRLLKDNKAVVVNTCPFTIKLTYKTSDYKQEIVLGVDSGNQACWFVSYDEKQGALRK